MDINGEMDKQKIKEKILKNGKEIYLSAQDYHLLSGNEKNLLKEALKEEGKDVDDYDGKMKKLWPKKVILGRNWRVR